jgi:hypothetical protein
MDIPSFLKPDLAASQYCWSHSMPTRVWVIKSTLFHTPLWQVCQGKRRPTVATKGSTRLPPTLNLPPLLLAAAVTAAMAVVSLASFCFPSLVAGIDLNLGERWGRGSLRAGEQCFEQFRCFPELNIKKKVNFYLLRL